MIAVTPEIGVQTLLKLGFSKIDTDGSDGYSDYNISIALGGLTVGCSVLEMTAGYNAIANKGIYVKPRYYTMVYDHNGNILLDNKPETTQVMKPATAWLLTDAMVDTTTIGTGTRCAFTKRPGIPVAGKTGTAHKNVDLWFVGFTPYYTAAIWSGYDNNLPQTENQYYRYLWRYIMDDVHVLKGYGLDENGEVISKKNPIKFEMPDSIVTARVCTKCGMLAVDGLCDAYAGGNCIEDEYFENGTQPHEFCTCHECVVICTESGERATPYCPSTTTRVLLKKVESAETLAHKGTSDTAYTISHASNTCSLHTSYYIPTPTPTPDGGATANGGNGGATTD
jgi:penicillin-binding protein 1A